MPYHQIRHPNTPEGSAVLLQTAYPHLPHFWLHFSVRLFFIPNRTTPALRAKSSPPPSKTKIGPKTSPTRPCAGPIKLPASTPPWSMCQCQSRPKSFIAQTIERDWDRQKEPSASSSVHSNVPNCLFDLQGMVAFYTGNCYILPIPILQTLTSLARIPAFDPKTPPPYPA